jgi:hypothetical protein
MQLEEVVLLLVISLVVLSGIRKIALAHSKVPNPIAENAPDAIIREPAPAHNADQPLS